jgi:hypothetical protein
MYYKIIDIIISIMLIISLIYKLFQLWFYRNKQTNTETFEDIITQTTIPESTPIQTPMPTPMPTPIPIPTDVDTKCTADNNVIGYCLNYNGCCTQNTLLNNGCFCNHPLVQKCKVAYDKCISSQNKDSINNCKDILKTCCLDYNKINIDIANFNKPIKQEQQSKMICSVSSTKNLDQKCMELCQTTPECKSYSVDTINCMLFSDIDPIQQKQGITPITDYYIKKI